MLPTFAMSGQGRLDFRPRAAATTSTSGWVVREEAIMGTTIRVELWADDRRSGEAAAAAAMDEMHRIDRATSPHKVTSELSRINREAARQPVLLSAEMTGLVAQALHYSRITGGAFDISCAAVGQLYDYRRRQRPTPAELAVARELVGWQGLHFDAQARTLRFARDGMRIDLGGFAKGHAVDRAALLLRQRGITRADISAGGDRRVIGNRCVGSRESATDTRPWTVALRDPRRPGEVVAVLPLEDCSVSTSGERKHGFDVGPERVHHLLDPATGRSPQHVHSVTVIAADGLASDALSKAVFVLGVQRGLALVDTQPGVDAVVIDAHGVLHASSSLLHDTEAVREICHSGARHRPAGRRLGGESAVDRLPA